MTSTTTKMTVSEQIRTLLNGYVIDRNTLEEISVPKKATRAQMDAIAAKHGLSITVVGSKVCMADSHYTYAVVDGRVETVAG